MIALKKWSVPMVAVVLAMGLGSVAVQAATQDITAVFRPDPSNPMVNKFTNTTPITGHCVTQPAFCAGWGVFSLLTTLSFSANQPIVAGNEMRQGAMFNVPSQWRPVQVTHSRTGEQETVEMRIAALGGWHELGARASQITGGGGHNEVWEGGGWSRDALPCLRTNGQVETSTGMAYFWRIPEGVGTCVKQARFQVPNLRYTSIHLAYELRTPNPLVMSSGEYYGSLAYSVGPGMDFDMGDVMIPNDNNLTFNFVLNVEHALKVDLPPGGNRIELLPQGGWQAWLNQGRAPSRLYRDQTFRLAASSRFKMQLECSLVINNTCGLRSDQGDEVPLQVAVTLPQGLAGQDDQAVNRRPLRLDGVGTELFQPLYYVNDRPGTLHFEVVRDDMAEMLKRPGSTYSGVVTVVWDSEV
ncbi:Uncharacterised protein [Pseudomonas fluorescens]|uniref:Fimbrial protein n=1 Tax=Pseudomonas fluorescens TaxID=294 RepID=A0A379IIP4_PSEFL|nr:hypothetical protein [Pseudomonas fluorescens]AIG02765.1 hypothetical protein HZ99_11555 [Pseudomonas fluorescens]SUD33169.1 Uncharacterised protein [Pseudomonas fluorescens]